MTLEALRQFFGGDAYATRQTGIEILEGGKGHALCRLVLNEKHANGYGFVMGGVLYTLADFCFAIASNTEQEATVTLSSAMQYHKAPKMGQTIEAHAFCLHDGRKTSAYEIRIQEESTGQEIATVQFTGYKTGKPGFYEYQAAKKEKREAGQRDGSIGSEA